MSGITPGPWKVGDQDGCYAEIDAYGWGALATVVVRMEDDESNIPQGEANARAIAEVPNMIEALEKAAVALENARYSEQPVAQELRELLARIKGAE